MENRLEKKYGLPTATAMVVGIVIGSGVFFKAEAVLAATGGDIRVGAAAWALAGAVMLTSAGAFAVVAARQGGAGGAADYAAAMVSPRYGYWVGWFLAVIYYPTLTAVLAWASARYLCQLLGWTLEGLGLLALAGILLCAAAGLNAAAPVVAGRLQVGVAAVKLAPLVLLGVVGIARGLSSGLLAENVAAGQASGQGMEGLLPAMVSVAFAYEGWIIAASISGELRRPRRDLPVALATGSLVVMGVYMGYYVGLAGAVPTGALLAAGPGAAQLAFQTLFGAAAGQWVLALVVVSCLGGLNGLTMANCRGLYALAVRGEGPRPASFARLSPVKGMPSRSAAAGLALAALWLVHYWAHAGERLPGFLDFDSSELPIITLYGMYVPIFLGLMARGRGLGWLKRFLLPALALAGCAFMVMASLLAHSREMVAYLLVFAGTMALGGLAGRPGGRGV